MFRGVWGMFTLLFGIFFIALLCKIFVDSITLHLAGALLGHWWDRGARAWTLA